MRFRVSLQGRSQGITVKYIQKTKQCFARIVRYWVATPAGGVPIFVRQISEVSGVLRQRNCILISENVAEVGGSNRTRACRIPKGQARPPAIVGCIAI